MERFTERTPSGVILRKPMEEMARLALNRLADFEDIGMEPKETSELAYKLAGVMHFVDKWLEGPELDKDEVQRAEAMRTKTLELVEALQKEVDRLHKENFWLTNGGGA